MKPIIHRKAYSEKIAEGGATLLDELIFIPLDGIPSRNSAGGSVKQRRGPGSWKG